MNGNHRLEAGDAGLRNFRCVRTTFLALMPFCETAHFGRIEYDAASRLNFSEGLPAFESERQFVLVQRPEQNPLVFLQSVTTPGLCFPALPVHVVERSYTPSLSDQDLELLGFTGQPVYGADALFLALIALHEDDPTANLLAPIVVNLSTRAAAQCVDSEMRYSHRCSLLARLEAAS
jgi:flagellar assembly factor FliW